METHTLTRQVIHHLGFNLPSFCFTQNLRKLRPESSNRATLPLMVQWFELPSHNSDLYLRALPLPATPCSVAISAFFDKYLHIQEASWPQVAKWLRRMIPYRWVTKDCSTSLHFVVVVLDNKFIVTIHRAK